MKEGKSVTLNTYTEIQEGDLILWILDTTVIAKIVGETRETIDDTNERFRDRLQLDHQTGSLTITNTTTTDSGEYKLQVIRNGKISYKEIRVKVSSEYSSDFSGL